jgi:hypothetical protein
MTRYRPPDTRLDWRDPDMPVLGKSGKPIDHRKMTVVANMRLQSNDPSWRDDPTYNLPRRKRRER